MNSYLYSIDEKEMAGAEFMAMVHEELQKAFVFEKKHNRLTQQEIAARLGVNRSVVNRQIGGLENVTSRSIGELLWAMGWRPKFEAVKSEPDDVGRNAEPAKSPQAAVGVILDSPMPKISAKSKASTDKGWQATVGVS